MPTTPQSLHLPTRWQMSAHPQSLRMFLQRLCSHLLLTLIISRHVPLTCPVPTPCRPPCRPAPACCSARMPSSSALAPPSAPRVGRTGPGEAEGGFQEARVGQNRHDERHLVRPEEDELCYDGLSLVNVVLDETTLPER